MNKRGGFMVEETMNAWWQTVRACRACPISGEQNRGPTGYTGTIRSPLMIVGEGPGGVEDEYGVPLVGPSGQLLDKALWSVGVTRDRVYVTNIVKCRPKGNRTPTLDEGRFCADRHLQAEIRLVRPAVIVALGKVAFQYFYGSAGSIVRSRGQWLQYQGIPVMPTYHPAFLLRRTGKDLVEAKWQVYYDLKSAVERAQVAEPEYVFKSDNIVSLLPLYEKEKEQRMMR